MNKYLKYIIVFAITLSGCTDEEPKEVIVKDKAYYEANITRAINKNKDCKISIKFAIETKNELKYKAIKSDKECNIVYKILKEKQRKINEAKKVKESRLRRAELEVKRRKREANQIVEERIYNIDYQKNLSILKQLTYKEFLKAKGNCRAYSTFQETPKCKAYRNLIKLKKEEAINKILEKENLDKYKKEVCKTKYDGSLECSLFKEAFKRQILINVKKYDLDKKKLKKDFNDCYKNITNLKKSKKWDELREVERSLMCLSVLESTKKIQLFSFSKPLK